MKYAPIVLFAYNRPIHLKRTLDALSRCPEAKLSELHIFCDGAKHEKTDKSVDEVRRIVRNISQGTFAMVCIIEREKNYGLAASVIDGVSRVIAEYGRVIVMEDDGIVSPHFLKFMNMCLERYEADEEIGSVSGSSPVLKLPADYRSDIYFTKRSSSFGWGTWKSRWIGVDWNLDNIADFYRDKELLNRLNLGGYDRFIRLHRQRGGKGNSWSVRFGAHHARKNWRVIYPRFSYIEDIGDDGSGTHTFNNHARFNGDLNSAIAEPNIDKPQENLQIERAFRKVYSNNLFHQLRQMAVIKVIVILEKCKQRLKARET